MLAAAAGERLTPAQSKAMTVGPAVVDAAQDCGREEPAAVRRCGSVTEPAAVADGRCPGSTDRRASRHLGTDSTGELLDFLAGAGEFARTGSQRRGRRARTPLDPALNDIRERVAAPSPPAAGDDLAAAGPALSRGGPGRWSLRERGTASPPLRAQWAARDSQWAREPDTGDSASRSHGSATRSSSDDCRPTVDGLLSRPVNTLEQRRRERLLPHHPPSVTCVARYFV